MHDGEYEHLTAENKGLFEGGLLEANRVACTSMQMSYIPLLSVLYCHAWEESDDQALPVGHEHNRLHLHKGEREEVRGGA